MILGKLKKYKAQLGDSIWSLCGLVLMNIVAQIIIFPLIRNTLGEASYGDIQYLMAYVNIITISVGCAANLMRITTPENEYTHNNGDYNVFLLAIAIICIPATILIFLFSGVKIDVPTIICYYLLFVFMMFRYYADVTFKIALNYKKYFVYYLAISIGYGIGIVLFYKTHIWPLALLPGEFLGVVFAYAFDKNMHKNFLRISPTFAKIIKGILILCISEGLSNLIFNADRLILKLFINSSAVTIYYLATLIGKTMSFVSTPLNGVIIGYLARYDGKLTKKMMNIVLVSCLISLVVFTGVCVFGGWLMLKLLYPQDLSNVVPFLLIGSIAQVIFFTTSIVTVILIRFAKKSYQLIINITFGICFAGFGIPATIFWGLWGFAYAMVIVNVIRFLISILLGFHWIKKNPEMTPEIKKQTTENNLATAI